jgi:uncharacterized protein YjbI with pentapeptide repeats
MERSSVTPASSDTTQEPENDAPAKPIAPFPIPAPGARPPSMHPLTWEAIRGAASRPSTIRPRRTTPAIPVVNAGSFKVATQAWQLCPPQDSLTVIVKGTFDLCSGGVVRARDESDLVTGDLHVDDDDAKSLRYASDFAVVKQRVDVTCTGRAYPPGGSGVATQAALLFDSIRRRVSVFGDRRWSRSLGFRTAPTHPATFASMPLVYERAFGGPRFEANPVGLGQDGDLLPNLEDPDGFIEGPSDTPKPACFGPISPTWSARTSKLGTYGGRWQKTRWPYFAEDFDAAYFQAAPPSQQIARAIGDEPFTIVGMHPEHVRFDGRLPGIRARCFVERVSGAFEELALMLDTIAFEMEEGKVNLVWRGLLSVSDDEAPEINALFIVSEGLAGPAMTLDAARAAYQACVTPPSVVPAPEDQEPRRGTSTPAADAEPPAPSVATEEPEPPTEGLAEALRNLGVSEEEIVATLGGAKSEDETKEPRPAGHDIERGIRGEVIRALEAGESLEGRDLAGADLTGLDLSGRSLARANLTGADLSGVRAPGADFSGAQLDGARFSESELAGARFDGASLVAADFTRASLERASLVDCKLDDVRLYEVRAWSAKFDRSSLTGARAEAVRLEGASLRGVSAERSIWEGATLDGATFAEARLAGSSFCRAQGVRTSFAAADLRGARLRRAALPEAVFLGANLMMATLERAKLERADLRKSNLHAAETWNASLEGAQLDLAILTRTKLSEAQ